MVIGIDDVVLQLVHMVPLVAVSLMCIEVDDNKALVAEPLFHIMRDKCDIWVDTEAATVRTVGVMVSTA